MSMSVDPDNALTAATAGTSWTGAVLAQANVPEASWVTLLLATLGLLALAVRAIDHLTSMYLQYKQLQARDRLLAHKWCPYSADGTPRCDETTGLPEKPDEKANA